MKPIEPGCLALYTGGFYVSGPLKGKPAPAMETKVLCGCSGANRCSVCSGSGRLWWTSDPDVPDGESAVCECKLIRIDGDPDEIKEREEMTA